MKYFLVSLLFALAPWADAQPLETTVVKDLEEDWKVFSGDHYDTRNGSNDNRTIYFLVDRTTYKGALLRIESQKEYSIFIGGRLIASNKKGIILYDLDSLSARYGSPLDFSIRKPAVKILTQIVIKGKLSAENEALTKRRAQYFLNFSILASLILLTFFVVLLRTNPKLTVDYLNFVKLFSTQEREENSMNMRITSSVNLLFYSFASMLTAFLTVVIFHFTSGKISSASFFQVSSLEDCFIQWLQLTVVILIILTGKLIVVSLFSSLYKASEITAMQFFNFVRLFFFTFGVISLLIAVFFIAEVLSPAWYYSLFYVAATIFIFWEIIIFLKLMTRLPFRIFHLFFYLCASELIPLVILIKVVFY